MASVDVLGADGTVETITGTTIHPVWSVDRQEWVPLAELADGESLCCNTESFGLGFPSSLTPKASGLVLSVSLSRVSQPVYNIEVHGEHVYQVGELGVLVHNHCPIKGPNLRILNPHFTPANLFVGKQAVVSAHLPAGRFTALVVDGQVYVARMHNVAWELAGRKGVEQFYGFCEIDALGKVVRLFK